MSLGPFHITGRPVVCPSLLGPVGGRVAVQLVCHLLFDRVLKWLWAGVCLYKARRCGNEGVRPVQGVHGVILVSRLRFGQLGHVA